MPAMTSAVTKQTLHVGRFTLTPDGLLRSPTAAAHLSVRLAKLLRALVLANGSVVSKRELLRRCWGAGRGNEQSLAKAVSELRRALSIGGTHSVATVYSYGYRLVELHPASGITNHDRAMAICGEAAQRLHQNEKPALLAGIRLYEGALGYDATLVCAHAGLADAYLRLMDLGYMQPGIAWHAARRAIELALRLRVGDAATQAVRGLGLSLAAWDFAAATEALAEARRLAPYAFLPNACSARHYLVCGRPLRAVEYFRAALDADPVSISSLGLLAYALACTGERAAAREAAARAIAIEPENALAQAHHCWIEAMIGDPGIARTSGAAAHEHLPDAATVAMTYAYALARSAEVGAARGLLDELTDRERFPYGCSALASVVWLELGEPAKALDALERARDEHCAWLPVMLHDPRIIALGHNPELERLRRSVF